MNKEEIEFDQDQAFSEGWCVSTCSGSMYFPDGWADIQMFADNTVFVSDWQALAHVAHRAAQGSVYHQKALEYQERLNFNLLKRSSKPVSKYNHLYFVGFTVISENECGEDVTADMLRKAIIKRLASLDDVDLINECEATDTYNEDDFD